MFDVAPDDAIRVLVVQLHAQRAERFSNLMQAPDQAPASAARVALQAVRHE